MNIQLTHEMLILKDDWQKRNGGVWQLLSDGLRAEQTFMEGRFMHELIAEVPELCTKMCSGIWGIGPHPHYHVKLTGLVSTEVTP